MAKKKPILGVDIGYDQLKLALVDDGEVVNTVQVKMPEKLLSEGRITSIETMGELIAQTMKTVGIKANQAALVLPNESVYVKNVKMPMMTVEQLKFNLPFEFNDYITGEVADFMFDYAVLPPEDNDKEDQLPPIDQPAEEVTEDASGVPETLNLMAVGAHREVVEEGRALLRKAGLKMVKAAPAISTYIALIRKQREYLSQYTDEYCILDLGYESIRMYMFKDDQHIATRALEVGLSTLDDVIADMYSVERHLAHTYLMNNFENCHNREECNTSYENIAVELMRAINFYRFSNPGSNLTDMWLCGGGAVIVPLINAIGEMLDMQLHTASELVPDGDDIEECNTYVQAIGITFE